MVGGRLTNGTHERHRLRHHACVGLRQKVAHGRCGGRRQIRCKVARMRKVSETQEQRRQRRWPILRELSNVVVGTFKRGDHAGPISEKERKALSGRMQCFQKEIRRRDRCVA